MILAGAAGLVQPEEGLPTILGFVCVAALGVVLGLYFRMGRSSDNGAGMQGQPPERLRKMTLLWYALSMVLAFGIVRKPMGLFRDGHASHVGVVEWAVCAAGLGMAGVAAWRISVIVRQFREN